MAIVSAITCRCAGACEDFSCMLGAYRGQEKSSDTLELELEMSVSHHVCAGNQLESFLVRATTI